MISFCARSLREFEDLDTAVFMPVTNMRVNVGPVIGTITAIGTAEPTWIVALVFLVAGHIAALSVRFAATVADESFNDQGIRRLFGRIR